MRSATPLKPMLRHPGWLLAAVSLLAGLLVVSLSLPVNYLTGAVERLTGHRLRLDSATGTIWSGQAVLTLVPSHQAHDARRLPGVFSWQVHPLSMWRGDLEIEWHNQTVLDHPLLTVLGVNRIRVSSGQATVPAEILAGLGAPWNTVGPGGTLALSWGAFDSTNRTTQPGAMTLRWTGASSRLTPVSPLGDYQLQASGWSAGARIGLETLSGPMEVQGNGTITASGELRFSGRAHARDNTDERTTNQVNSVISLFGPHHGDEVAINIGM
jgi:general secretion pathway protein N